MIRQYIWFDSYIKTRSGKRIPYADFSVLERRVNDQELIWFHESYGLMMLYRVHKVDDENFVAEYMRVSCYTSSDNWERYLDDPELALSESWLAAV